MFKNVSNFLDDTYISWLRGEGTYFNSIKKGPGGAHRNKDA